MDGSLGDIIFSTCSYRVVIQARCAAMSSDSGDSDNDSVSAGPSLSGDSSAPESDESFHGDSNEVLEGHAALAGRYKLFPGSQHSVDFVNRDLLPYKSPCPSPSAPYLALKSSNATLLTYPMLNFPGFTPLFTIFGWKLF